MRLLLESYDDLVDDLVDMVIIVTWGQAIKGDSL